MFVVGVFGIFCVDRFSSFLSYFIVFSLLRIVFVHVRQSVSSLFLVVWLSFWLLNVCVLVVVLFSCVVCCLFLCVCVVVCGCLFSCFFVNVYVFQWFDWVSTFRYMCLFVFMCVCVCVLLFVRPLYFSSCGVIS